MIHTQTAWTPDLLEAATKGEQEPKVYRLVTTDFNQIQMFELKIADDFILMTSFDPQFLTGATSSRCEVNGC